MIENHINVREHLGSFIGKRVIDITQNDDDEFDPKDPQTAYVEFFFEDGGTIRMFNVLDNVGTAYVVQHGDECKCNMCEEDAASKG